MKSKKKSKKSASQKVNVKKEVTKQPLRVYIEYTETRSGGEEIDPEDRWSSREDEEIEVTFIRLHKEPPTHRFFYDSIELPNDKMIKLNHLYLAVVRYSTGDTFSHTNGAWYIVSIAPTYDIAKKMLDEETTSKPGRYKRWEGYFESLEGTEIHDLDLV